MQKRASTVARRVPQKMKRFQATFRFSLFPGRHARPEHGRHAQSGLALLLPATAFEPRRISAPERFRNRPARSLRLATAFHSPPWLCSFEHLREGSTLPACCFSPIPNLTFRPVRFATPGLTPLLHCLRGADLCRVPVAGRQFGIPKPFFSLHSPLGERPSGSTCLPTLAWEAHLRPQLDFRSLPATGSVLSSPVSDHRSRFAVAGEACCSF